jgi:hypothetical protein
MAQQDDISTSLHQFINHPLTIIPRLLKFAKYQNKDDISSFFLSGRNTFKTTSAPTTENQNPKELEQSFNIFAT